MSFVKRIFGDPNERELKKIRPLVEKINGLEDEIAALSDDDLRARTAEMREQLDHCEDQDEQDDLLDSYLPQAFAMVREAGQRAIGQRHYDVQLIGGIVLHQGKIAEMRTGEGKTLVATLPAYLNALTGRGVHVITVNDYLAKLHADWMGQIHRFLGLSVGAILSGPEHGDPVAKRAAYHADITYGTNNEFGFDYLRDNMVATLDQCVQRQLNFAIVDEVDSILIDEARTPLIISAPSSESAEMYSRFARVVPMLKEDDDFEVDLKTRTVAINEAGIDKVEAALGLANVYSDMALTRYLENALKAHATMLRDRDYIVTNGEVIIIDEHTGRQMIGRRYNEGLHQAIEAKERVKVQAENRTVATITFQNYFRIYRKLAGMTGTAITEAQEFDKIYKLDVVVIPTHRPMIRKDEMDLIYKTTDAKFNAVVEEIREHHETGQPVLVGTTSVDLSEMLSEKLRRAGIEHEILNAKNHLREAQIIAQAGRLGAVTLSTNMAGRGTDILLGGNPDGLVETILLDRDIDLDVATDEDHAEALAEAKRRCADEHDRVIALGGLYVIGTERHDSRRIDNQLRGRAGRQGDPGVTRFFVSLYDDLMRRFGSDRVATMMDRFGLEDDVPIESGMAARMIEQAQTKVEAYYFDIRKNIVEYDDVISKQREVIYEDRHGILAGEHIHERVVEMLVDEVGDIVRSHTQAPQPEQWNLDAIVQQFERWRMSLPEDAIPENLNLLKRDSLINICVEWSRDQYEARADSLDAQLALIGADPNEVTGAKILEQIERNILLRVVDMLWMDHIDALDVLRSGIGLRSIAQRDPLVEFKNEAFESFAHLKRQIRHFVAENALISSVQIGVPPPAPVAATPPPQQLRTNTAEIAAATGQVKAVSDDPALRASAAGSAPKVPKRPLTQTKAIKRAARDNGAARPLGDGQRMEPSAPPNGQQHGEPSAPPNGQHGEPSAPPNGQPATNGAAPHPIPAAPVPVGNGLAPAGGPKSRPLATATRVGPKDPCPCGSKQQYRFCHGAGKRG